MRETAIVSGRSCAIAPRSSTRANIALQYVGAASAARSGGRMYSATALVTLRNMRSRRSFLSAK